MKILFKKMFKLVCSILILISSVVFAEIKIGENAINFSLKDSKNNSIVSLNSFKGKKIVYVNFFATWCANCKEEMNTLNNLYSTYKDEGLEMIAINVKEKPDKVNKFISKYKIPFTVLLDEKAKVAKDYNLVGFPSNILIDGEGKIRFIDSRPPTNFQELFDELKSTIKPVEKPALNNSKTKEE